MMLRIAAPRFARAQTERIGPVCAREVGRRELQRTVQPGGYVLLSGITETQAHATTTRYASLGFVLEKQILLDGWAALLLGRRNASTLFD